MEIMERKSISLKRMNLKVERIICLLWFCQLSLSCEMCLPQKLELNQFHGRCENSNFSVEPNKQVVNSILSLQSAAGCHLLGEEV